MAVKTLTCTALTRWRWYSAVALARSGELPPAMMRRQQLLNKLAFTPEEKERIHYQEDDAGNITLDPDVMVSVELTGAERKALRHYVLHPASPWLVGPAEPLIAGAEVLGLKLESADSGKYLETISFSRAELAVMVKQLTMNAESNFTTLASKVALLHELQTALAKGGSLVLSKWAREVLIEALEQPQAPVAGDEIVPLLSALQKLGYVPEPIVIDEDDDDDEL